MTGAPDAMAIPSLTVLVVEDEVLIQDLIGPELEEAGFAVVYASSGVDALRTLEHDHESTIRAVVTDIDLKSAPVTGWSVAKRAREMHPEIPVVYISGGSAHDWAANGVPNSLMIPKPFASAQVVTAVSQLLNAAPTPSVRPPV